MRRGKLRLSLLAPCRPRWLRDRGDSTKALLSGVFVDSTWRVPALLLPVPVGISGSPESGDRSDTGRALLTRIETLSVLDLMATADAAPPEAGIALDQTPRALPIQIVQRPLSPLDPLAKNALSVGHRATAFPASASFA